MKKRLIINLSLLILLLSLAAIAWLKPGQQISEQLALVPIDIANIDSIRIERAQAETIELNKQQQQWRLIAPLKANALAGKLERLLKISQIKPVSSYPLEPESMQRFGLQAAVAKIYFNDIEVLIGRTESVNSRRYASSSGQLHLLDDTFLHHLTAPLSAYIDNRLLADGAQVIALQTANLNLQQGDDNSWQNKFHPTQSVSADAVQILFDEWRFARAISVNEQLGTETGESIRLQLSNQQVRQFNLIRQQNKVLLVDNNTRLAYQFSLTKYQQMSTLSELE
ncbi:MAG: hypothetical protein RPR28_08765 [Cycloclasticus sp.]